MNDPLYKHVEVASQYHRDRKVEVIPQVTQGQVSVSIETAKRASEAAKQAKPEEQVAGIKPFVY